MKRMFPALLALSLGACAAAAEPADPTGAPSSMPTDPAPAPIDAGAKSVHPEQACCRSCTDDACPCRPCGGGGTYPPGAGNIW